MRRVAGVPKPQDKPRRREELINFLVRKEAPLPHLAGRGLTAKQRGKAQELGTGFESKCLVHQGGHSFRKRSRLLREMSRCKHCGQLHGIVSGNRVGNCPGNPKQGRKGVGWRRNLVTAE